MGVEAVATAAVAVEPSGFEVPSPLGFQTQSTEIEGIEVLSAANTKPKGRGTIFIEFTKK